jgi:hypothetical protein
VKKIVSQSNENFSPIFFRVWFQHETVLSKFKKWEKNFHPESTHTLPTLRSHIHTFFSSRDGVVAAVDRVEEEEKYIYKVA